MNLQKIQVEELRNQETLEVERLRVLAKHRLDARKRAEEEEIRLEELKLKRRFFMQHNRDALKAPEVKDEPKQRSAGGGGGSRKRKHNKERRFDDSDGFVDDYTGEDDKVRRKKNKVSLSIHFKF